uniref:PAS domain-containing protein n=1 Tax=Attheya septentrionalis TaxID=420275 RepID=A0A7S2U740_9STRA|mmetsp:Transcript_13329/g.24155  ORF Transcript_13329/g.24155 Transcript_13329/m.24155 type:complete len:185 (+) Transcript_13329:241-795(+)
MTSVASSLLHLLQSLFPSYEPMMGSTSPATGRHFDPEKQLCEKDCIILDMLSSAGHENVCFCVTDPSQVDNPIVFASDGFCKFTGYLPTEIEGRNCRFLQGPDTCASDVSQIRDAIEKETDTSVNLLNYRKDGTPFVNEFFLSPLRDDDHAIIYYIGVQCPVPKSGPGQMPANPGWVYSQGSHA